MTPSTLVLAMTKTYGGAEECLRILLRRLLAAAPRRSITVASDHPRLADLPAHRAWRGSSSVATVPAAIRTIASLLVLARRVVRMRPSTTIANGFRSTILLALLSPFIAGRKVVYIHDARRRGLDLLLRWIRPVLVLVPAPPLVGRCAPMWRAIAAQGFSAPTPRRPRARSTGEPLRVASIANLVRLKGVEHAVTAVAALVATGVQARLAIYGEVVDAAYAAEVDAAIAQSGAGTAIQRRGFAPKDEIYAAADVVVVTTVTAHGGPETFGRVIVESFECGIPVVAFACGGPAWLIRDGVSGVLVREGDDAGLLAALRRLHDDTEWYARLSAGAILERARLQARLDATLDRVVRCSLFADRRRSRA